MAEKKEPSKIILALMRRINDYESRLKLVEQRLEMLDNEVLRLNKLILEKMEDLEVGIDMINKKIISLNKKLEENKLQIELLNKSLDRKVSKEEFAEIKGFLDLFSPLKTSFVTRDEVLKMIQRMKK